MEISVYTLPDGKCPFQKWLSGIDVQARLRVQVAIDRLAGGNTGSLKSVGNGVHEIRLTYGAGIRIYVGKEGNEAVILLYGGTKRRQDDDIARAKELWRGYLNETRQ